MWEESAALGHGVEAVMPGQAKSPSRSHQYPQDVQSLINMTAHCPLGGWQIKTEFCVANFTQYKFSNASFKENFVWKQIRGSVVLHWNQVSFIFKDYHCTKELCKSPRFTRQPFPLKQYIVKWNRLLHDIIKCPKASVLIVKGDIQSWP